MKRILCLRYLFASVMSIFILTIATANEKTEINIFTSGRIGMTQSVELPGKGELYFVISHRFGDINGGFYDFFGLDLATIRLGFDYGVFDRFALGIGRSSFEKSYDFFAKICVLRQMESGSPVAITGNFAASVNTLKNIYLMDQDGLWDRSSLSGQALIARRQGKISLQTALLFFRNNFETRLNDDLNLLAFTLSASYKVSKRIALTAQYIPILNKPSFAGDNPLTLGFDIDTGGHHFQLSFSNSTALFEKSLITDTQGNWAKGRIFFGFNLTRVFYLK